jgi:hypothetical protein
MQETCIITEPGPEAPDTPALTLEQLEDIIKKNEPAYLRIGAALAQIRERNLFKPNYKTWKEYVETRWSFSRSHAYRLINAAKLANASPIGDIPENEHQARKRLSKQQVEKLFKNLDPEAQFKNFKLMLGRWEKGLSPEARGELIERIIAHLQSMCEQIAKEAA